MCNVRHYCTQDEQYWERRRRNNDSARRSREARRHKEEGVGVRALCLEHENARVSYHASLMNDSE